jgi:predicted nucleotidyltransferase
VNTLIVLVDSMRREWLQPHASIPSAARNHASDASRRRAWVAGRLGTRDTLAVMLSDAAKRSPDLAAIVQRIVDCYRPERIYLFGSHARGDARDDSDYDLLVLVPDDASAARRDAALFYANQIGLHRGADVVVATRSQFESYAERVASSLAAIVRREGVLVYAA